MGRLTNKNIATEQLAKVKVILSFSLKQIIKKIIYLIHISTHHLAFFRQAFSALYRNQRASKRAKLRLHESVMDLKVSDDETEARSRSCYVCELAGKSSQALPPVPLHQILLMGEQFQFVVLACCPEQRSVNTYLPMNAKRSPTPFHCAQQVLFNTLIVLFHLWIPG